MMRYKIHGIDIKLDRPYTTDQAIKALKPFDSLGGLEVEVLGIPFGGPLDGKDKDGNFFDEHTDIGMIKGDPRPLIFFHGFNLDGTAFQNPIDWIGQAKFTRTDDSGHWFMARLDSRSQLANRITPQRLRAGMIRASSGAVGHLATWPIGEMSIFDTNSIRKPSNDFAIVNLNSVATKGAENAVETNKVDKVFLIKHIIKEII